MTVRSLAALAVALAILPAAAADRDADAPRAEKSEREVALPVPGMPAVRIDHALDGLRHLRLRPGQDDLDVTETARRRPERATE